MTLGSNNAPPKEYERFHEAITRLMKDSTIPPFKQSLGTKHPAEFAESSSLPVFADEMNDQRRRDSWLGHIAMIFIGTTGVLGFIAFLATR